MTDATMVEPIRIFVGTEDNQMPAARVLEYTIRQHTRHPVQVEFMRNYHGRMPKHRQNRPRTTFSFCRLQIPALCGYQGRAIYMDADMQVFGDVEELWCRPFNSHKIMVTRQDVPPDVWKDNSWFHPGRQMSVMVLDCSRLNWEVDEIVAGLDQQRYSYAALMFDMCLVADDEIDDTLPPEWNHLERYEPGISKLVHYTVVPTQPWKNDQNPRRDLWMAAYRDAVAAGAIVPEEVELLVRTGELKAALLEEFGGRAVNGHARVASLDRLRPLARSLRRNVSRLRRVRR
jgi:hypothetical protein